MTLNQRDLAMFRKLGIGPELLTQAGVERVSDLEARDTYGTNGYGDRAGLVFPYFDPVDGQRRTARLRRDNPEIEDGKPKNKYISAYGDRRHLYFVPGCSNLLDDHAVPIVLVEAEKSALALTAWAERSGRKIIPVAMGGCWGWRGRVGKVENPNGERVDETGPLPDLQHCAGHVTYILLDANCATNTKVQYARRALEARLRKMGVDVRTLNLPGGDGVNGPDDFIAVCGDEALSELFESTAPNQPMAISQARVDMPDTVLDGRLGGICQQRLSRFPRAYAWPSLLTAAGVLIPRINRPLRTNLYTCLVGAPGSGKTDTFTTACKTLGIWQDDRLLRAKFGSAEGLMERLQDVKPGASRLIAPDELSHLLSKAAIDRSSFPSVLNTAFYDDQHSGGTKGKSFSFDCRLSLAGGVVEELFGDSFGMATTGGLYDRFIFGLCPQPYQFFWRPFEGDSEQINPVPADVSPDVWEVRDQWLMDGMNKRVAENALRVAYICACVDGRPSLRACELDPALAFARYQTRVRRLLAPNPGENPDARCAIAIRNWLTEHAAAGRSIRRRDLDRGISSFRYGPGVFNRCLNNLQFNKEIDISQDGKTVTLLGDLEGIASDAVT